MKLNFWQWLAVVLLIVGIAWWAYDWSHAGKKIDNSAPASQATR